MSKKAELLAQTNESLTRVKRILKLIDENRTHYDSLDEILDKPLLLRMKDAFETKYKPLILKLSEPAESAAGSADSASTDDEEVTKIKQISQKLKDLARELNKAEKNLNKILSGESHKEHLKSLLSSKKAENAALREQITLLSSLPAIEDFDNPDYKLAHKKYILTQEAYQTQLGRFSESPKTVPDYDLMILQSQQLLDTYQKVLHAYQPFAEAFQHYQRSYDAAQRFCTEWQEMDSGDLKELKRDDPSSDLCGKIEAFQRQLAQLKHVSSSSTTHTTPNVIMETSKAVLTWISELRKTKHALETEMKDRVNITQAAMKATKMTFMVLRHQVTEQMHQISAATTEVDAISTQFEACFALSSPSDDDILFQLRKSRELHAIVAKLQTVVEKNARTTPEKMREKIQALQDTTIEAYKGLLRQYAQINALIPTNKTPLFHRINSRLTDLQVNREMGDLRGIDYPNLVEKHQQLFEDRLEFDTLIQEAEELIRFYTTIKTLSEQSVTEEKELFIPLLRAELDKTSGPALLSTLHTQLTQKHTYHQVTQWILDSIGDFSPTGLTALNTYFEGKNGATVKQIKEKIAFINLLTAQGIIARPCLENEHCVAGVLYLQSQGELNPTLHLTDETLANTSFWNAINVFKKLGLSINASTAQALFDSADRCAIIVQQYEQYAGLKRLDAPSLKAIISTVVKQDANMSKAFITTTNFPGVDRGFYAAANIALLTESEQLRQIFAQTERYKLGLAASFLNHLLQQAPNDVDLVNHYFSSNNDAKQQAGEKFKGYLRKNAELIQNLQNALNDPNSNALKTMALFFIKFNQWSTDYVGQLPPKEQQKMNDFRIAMAPILLTNASTEVKQQQVEALAKQHFEPKLAGLINLVDVLMTITGLFVLISPILRGITGHAFFFSQLRTNHHKEVHERMKKEWGSMSHDSGEATPLLEDMDGIDQAFNGAGTGIENAAAAANPDAVDAATRAATPDLDDADAIFAKFINDDAEEDDDENDATNTLRGQ
jgi:hypothetical protein